VRRLHGRWCRCPPSRSNLRTTSVGRGEASPCRVALARVAVWAWSGRARDERARAGSQGLVQVIQGPSLEDASGGAKPRRASTGDDDGAAPQGVVSRRPRGDPGLTPGQPGRRRRERIRRGIKASKRVKLAVWLAQVVRITGEREAGGSHTSPRRKLVHSRPGNQATARSFGRARASGKRAVKVRAVPRRRHAGG